MKTKTLHEPPGVRPSRAQNHPTCRSAPNSPKPLETCAPLRPRTGALRCNGASRTKRAGSSLLIFSVTFFVASAVGQAVKQEGELRIAEFGPHHRVVERTISELQPDGTWRERKSSYTELANGMHYLDEQGRLTESREEIRILNGSPPRRRDPSRSSSLRT